MRRREGRAKERDSLRRPIFGEVQEQDHQTRNNQNHHIQAFRIDLVDFHSFSSQSMQEQDNYTQIKILKNDQITK